MTNFLKVRNHIEKIIELCKEIAEYCEDDE